MARYGEQGADDKAPLPADEPFGGEDGGHGLEDINGGHNGGVTDAVGAQGVGHTGVAAAEVADVLVMSHMRGHNSAADGAQQIGDEGGGEIGQNRISKHMIQSSSEGFSPGLPAVRDPRPAGGPPFSPACPPWHRPGGSGFPDSAGRRSGTAGRRCRSTQRWGAARRPG